VVTRWFGRREEGYGREKGWKALFSLHVAIFDRNRNLSNGRQRSCEDTGEVDDPRTESRPIFSPICCARNLQHVAIDHVGGFDALNTLTMS
jgi:hypothetical protein